MEHGSWVPVGGGERGDHGLSGFRDGTDFWGAGRENSGLSVALGSFGIMGAGAWFCWERDMFGFYHLSESGGRYVMWGRFLGRVDREFKDMK